MTKDMLKAHTHTKKYQQGGNAADRQQK